MPAFTAITCLVVSPANVYMDRVQEIGKLTSYYVERAIDLAKAGGEDNLEKVRHRVMLSSRGLGAHMLLTTTVASIARKWRLTYTRNNFDASTC